MKSSPSQHTFLFADLAGFTALTEAHGDDRAADLAQAFALGIRNVLPAYEASEVKSLGDGMMVHVADPAQAIALGARVVSAVAGRGGLPLARVGMHTGPAAERGGDWYGGAVNVAARVCELAPPGEVLLTDATRTAAGDLPDLALDGLGERSLRNVLEPVAIYRVRPYGGLRRTYPVDPVCRTVVEPGRKVAAGVHQSAVYPFCSVRCAAAFARAPDRYVASLAGP
jgi:adenylate cyclase